MFTLAVAALLALSPGTSQGFQPDGPNETVPLYGVTSGFAKARVGVLGERRSIVVGWLPGQDYDGTNAVIDAALDQWNTAAGWQIFILSPDNLAVDVSWHVNDQINLHYGGWTDWVQFETGWYRHCSIFLHSWGPPLHSTYAHELGHCLGFQDVQTTLDTGYRGIMSYARSPLTTPDNEQDVASLQAVGYRP